MSLNDPQTPAEYARAIGLALDRQDQTVYSLINKFSIAYPNEYKTFLPIMQAEVLRRKQ